MRSKMKWGDFLIIGLVLCGAISLSIALMTGQKGDTMYAEIWQNENRIHRIKLSENKEQIIDIDGHNIIEINGLTAKMKEADCHDGVCVRTGVLTKSGQAAVCLPNKVVLKLVSEESDFDAIVS